MQAVKGYINNGRFMPENGMALPNRVKAILIIEELAQSPSEHEPIANEYHDDEISDEDFSKKHANLIKKIGLSEAKRRIAWLKRLHECIESSMDEEPFELPPRVGGMRPPVLFED